MQLQKIQDSRFDPWLSQVDKDVVVDRNQISTRKPDDLPAFCRAIIAQAAK